MIPYALSFELPYDPVGTPWFDMPSPARVLNAREIMELRRGHDPASLSADSPWNRTYVTSTWECRGFTARGDAVVAIHHSTSGDTDRALADPDLRTFHALLEGKYGDIAVFDGDTVGPFARNSRDRHDRAFAEVQVGGADLANALIKQVERQTGYPSGSARFGRSGKLDMRSMAEQREKPDSVPLSASALYRSRPDEQPKLDLGIGYGSGNRAIRRHCVAVAISDAPPVDIAPPLSMWTVLHDPERTGWRKQTEAPAGMLKLRCFGDRMMTDIEEGMPRWLATDPGWPGVEVLSFQSITMSDFSGRNSDLHNRMEKSPPGANACFIGTEADGSTFIQFGKAVVDRTLRMPTREEFTTDLQARIEIAAAHAERWWRAKQERRTA